MKVIICPTCRKIWKCENNGECKHCSVRRWCHDQIFQEVEDEECQDCRDDNTRFYARR